MTSFNDANFGAKNVLNFAQGTGCSPNGDRLFVHTELVARKRRLHKIGWSVRFSINALSHFLKLTLKEGIFRRGLKKSS